MNIAASTAGFRGPAKRAAFGDVTNLAKNVGDAYQEHKLTKVQSLAQVRGLAQVHSLANKENAPGKKALARPAQRPVPLASKPKNVIDVRSRDLPKKPQRSTREQASLVVKADNVEAAYEAPIEDNIDQSSSQQLLTESVSRQPRHHKSQPQLKQQQPILRKTQSRHLESTEIPEDRSMLTLGNSSAILIDDLPEESAHGLEVETVSAFPYADGISDHLDHHTDLRVRLPEISEEPAIDSATFKDGIAQALSEPEEYWDEEEDDYEDQDQGYTTANSLRSRDMTTNGITTVLQPRLTARVQSELDEARLEVLQTRPQEDIEEEAWDISMVAEYGDEIFEYMRDLEVSCREYPAIKHRDHLLTRMCSQTKMLPNPHYMDIQTEIQWSMRSVLMDWLVQVHKRFSLLPETLFLTVNYIDRFLSSKVVSIGKLQLVGATALLVASKYEEINCPSLQEIVYMVDGGYTTDEILKAERFMLSMLGYELGWPGPMSFLRRVSKADDYDLETRTLAKYFLELTIMDERFVATPPSFVAAGAHCLSRLILNKGDWVSCCPSSVCSRAAIVQAAPLTIT